MNARKTVEVRFDDNTGKWWIYWGGSDDLAHPDPFDSIEEAGPRMRELMGYEEREPRRPALQRIG